MRLLRRDRTSRRLTDSGDQRVRILPVLIEGSDAGLNLVTARIVVIHPALSYGSASCPWRAVRFPDLIPKATSVTFLLTVPLTACVALLCDVRESFTATALDWLRIGWRFLNHPHATVTGFIAPPVTVKDIQLPVLSDYLDLVTIEPRHRTPTPWRAEEQLGEVRRFADDSAVWRVRRITASEKRTDLILSTSQASPRRRRLVPQSSGRRQAEA